MNTAEQQSERDPVEDVPPGFVDAVMRSIAGAPLPSPTRAFTSALHDRSRRDAQGALGVAWRLLRAGAAMPMMVRAQALALLLLVGGSAIGGGAVAAVATYQTVAPIVLSVVGPSADDRGVLIPALADPSPAPTPSPSAIPALAPPGDPQAVDPDEPTSTGLGADDEVNDDPSEGDAGELDGEDAEEGLGRETEPDDKDEDAGANRDDPDDEGNTDAEEPDADGDEEADEPDADGDGAEDRDGSDPDEDQPDDPDDGSGEDAPSGDEPDGAG